MEVIVRYEVVSPVVIDYAIRKANSKMFCMWQDLGEDSFSIKVCGWSPLTAEELVQAERVLARYV